MIARGIEVRRGKCCGEPCVAGTRVRVQHVNAVFLSGVSFEDTAASFGITVQQAQDCLRFMHARRSRRKADAWARELALGGK